MSNWTTRAQASKGTPYGHVPGHQYHDVDVSISDNFDPLGQRTLKHRVEILEVWGSAQGCDEEHGRNRIVAIDADLDEAVRIASSRADTAGMRKEYVVQALSQAHADAVDAEPGV